MPLYNSYYHSYRGYPSIAARLINRDISALNDLDWRTNPALARSLENSIVQSNLDVRCEIENVSFIHSSRVVVHSGDQ